MDTNNPNQRDSNVRSDLELRLVNPMETGEGRPYAPENWPCHGDIWRWKVGIRVSTTGHFLERWLYPPKHFPSAADVAPNQSGALRSKPAVERYLKLNFPGVDLDHFFTLFSWRVPCKIKHGNRRKRSREALQSHGSKEEPKNDNQSVHVVCKAGNDKCTSLMPLGENRPLPTMPCDICCSEPNFCSDCCCILCCKPIVLEHGGSNRIKCEAVVCKDDIICGHVAHITCALNARMVGTVGGSLGLDAEYYCRRCDSKTDLVPYVSRCLEICQTVESRDEVKMILKLGIVMLRGSKQAKAKVLLNRAESAFVKLECGTNLKDIWNVDASTVSSDVSDAGDAKDNVKKTRKLHEREEPIGPTPFNHKAEMQNLEEEICQALKALRKAQDLEYKVAEESLRGQKDYLEDLYGQLDKEKSELNRCVSGGVDVNDLITAVLRRLNQVKKEVAKLKEMEGISNGFGRTPRAILEEYFHLRAKD